MVTVDVEEMMAATVLSNDVACFILTKVLESGWVSVEELNANLAPPEGWLAVCRLFQARFVDCIGDGIAPTEAGRKFGAWLEEEMRR